MKLREFGIATALVCGLVFSASGASADNACVFKRGANLDMSLEDAGRPSIPVMVNGVQKQFVVDTGGAFSAVSGDTTQALKLRTQPVNKNTVFFTVSGTDVRQAAVAETFQIGQLPLKNESFIVMPGGMGAPNFDGLVGADILHFFDVEFDFANAKFELFLQNDCGARVVHWPHQDYGVLPFKMNVPKQVGTYGMVATSTVPDWHIIAPAKLDGVDVDVLVDTGASISYMTLEDARQVSSAIDEKKMKPLDESAPADDARYSHTFSSLSLGAINIGNPAVILGHNKMGAMANWGHSRPELILGVNVLRRLHLYINYKDQIIYVTDATAH
jgi:predicted aspartyl protease